MLKGKMTARKILMICQQLNVTGIIQRSKMKNLNHKLLQNFCHIKCSTKNSRFFQILISQEHVGVLREEVSAECLMDVRSQSNYCQMRSLQEKSQKQKLASTCDEDKRYQLFKKLTAHSFDQFREVNIDEFDLNITEHIEELEEIDSSVSPLIYASYYGLKDIMRILLKNKLVDVDMETENNRQTPLITACLMGNYEIARLLLLAKAEVNKPNLLNQIPLTVVLFRLVEEPASFQNKKICFLIADLLIKHGADLNWIIDKKNGFSLLHYFCSLKMKMNKSQRQLNTEIIKYLLEKGADYKQLTLGDKSCQQLLEGHCNKQELLRLFEEAKAKEQIKAKEEQPKKKEVKPYKKIDANFFKI